MNTYLKVNCVSFDQKSEKLNDPKFAPIRYGVIDIMNGTTDFFPISSFRTGKYISSVDFSLTIAYFFTVGLSVLYRGLSEPIKYDCILIPKEELSPCTSPFIRDKSRGMLQRIKGVKEWQNQKIRCKQKYFTVDIMDKMPLHIRMFRP